jgi:hypothetical protein
VRSNTSNVLVAFLTIVTLVALTGYQVTGETSSVRLLGRLGGALIEIDRWLPAHRDDLELLARDRPDQPLVLTDMPIEVAIPASAALEAPAPVLEATIVEAMGHKLYDDGYSAIQDEQGESHLGITEPLRWAIDGLDSSAHSFWRLAVVVTGLALIAICLAHFWTRQSPLPGVAVGSAVAAIGALALWLVVSALGSSVSGAIDEEIAEVAKDGIWIGLRNSLAATGIGLGGLYVYSTLFGTRGDEDWEQWDDFDYDAYEPEHEAKEAPPY